VDGAERGRLVTRLSPRRHPADPPLDAGCHELSFPGVGRALLRVPTGLDGRPPVVLVTLHGAGGSAAGMLTLVAAAADRHGLLVLAPQSTRSSWDVIHGDYGPDVRLLDAALAHVLTLYPVVPGNLAISGFSDGASSAVSLGIANGDLFAHVLAWSPGFAAPRVQNGRPRFFVSHGTGDSVLPIGRCSRPLVASLRSAGYDVEYLEFDGPHMVPPEVVEASTRWLADAAPGDDGPPVGSRAGPPQADGG
jgi:phospholipase/carboxylesterase